jgi:uncharacterized membrane protein YgcG
MKRKGRKVIIVIILQGTETAKIYGYHSRVQEAWKRFR